MSWKLWDIWNKRGFEILVCVSIVAILVLALFRIGKKGTWSTTYETPIFETTIQRRSQSQRPRPTRISRGELECKYVLEQIFNKPFISTRPDFLRNPVTGSSYNLEIDCYNDELKLGVEYNGIQHYKYIPYFHKNFEAFRNQQYRDELKRMKCRENGIRLIEVPYTVKIPDIRNYLIKELSKYK